MGSVLQEAMDAVLPLLIEFLKNRIDDSLHAGHVGEYHHGPGAPPDFDEAMLDGIWWHSLRHNGCGESKNVSSGPMGGSFQVSQTGSGWAGRFRCDP